VTFGATGKSEVPGWLSSRPECK